MNRIYTKYLLQDGGARYLETREDGLQRMVDAEHTTLKAWLEQGNTPAVVPYVPPSLESLKADGKARVNALRALRFNGVFSHGPGRYDLDDDSRNKMTGVAAMIACNRVGGTILWRDHDNVIQALAPQAFLDLCDAVNLYSQALYQASWVKKQEIDALDAPEAVAAYAVDAGWPEANSGGA